MKYVIFLFFLTLLFAGCDKQMATSNRTDKDLIHKSLYHNLLIQWKDSINPSVRDKMLDLLRGIPHQIEGFEAIAFQSLESGVGEFDLLVIQKYTSKEAEERYQEHPDHLEAKSLGPQLIKKMIKFDYWAE